MPFLIGFSAIILTSIFSFDFHLNWPEITADNILLPVIVSKIELFGENWLDIIGNESNGQIEHSKFDASTQNQM